MKIIRTKNLNLTQEEHKDLKRQMNEEGVKTLVQLIRKRLGLGTTRNEKTVWHTLFKQHNK